MTITSGSVRTKFQIQTTIDGQGIMHMLQFFILIVVCTLAGSGVGTITGLIPGIHVNTVALLLVAGNAILIAGFTMLGVPVFQIPLLASVMITATSMTHTFVDFVPSTFLGVPDPDTALSVLPAHDLLLEGNGYRAVHLSAVGSALAVLIGVMILIPYTWVLGAPLHGYLFLKEQVLFILFFLTAFLVATEETEIRGSRLLGILCAILIFIISGILGLVVLPLPSSSPLGLYSTVLFPLFSGLFGLSTLFLSLNESMDEGIPPQKISCPHVDRNGISSAIPGAIAGSIVGFLPGVSSAHASLVAMIPKKEKKRKKVDEGGKEKELGKEEAEKKKKRMVKEKEMRKETKAEEGEREKEMGKGMKEERTEGDKWKEGEARREVIVEENANDKKEGGGDEEGKGGEKRKEDVSGEKGKEEGEGVKEKEMGKEKEAEEEKEVVEGEKEKEMGKKEEEKRKKEMEKRKGKKEMEKKIENVKGGEGGGNRESVIITMGAVNTSNAFFVLVALFLTGNARSGAAVAIQEFIPGTEWNGILPYRLCILLMAVILSSLVAYHITLLSGRKVAANINTVPYEKLVMGIIILVCVLVLLFNGMPGMLILVVSTCTGILPQTLGVRRSHLMGVLLIPVMVYFW